MYRLFAHSRSHHLTNARWPTLIAILYLALGTYSLVSGVLIAVTLAIPRHGVDAPDAAFQSCFGLGMLAAGYAVRWERPHRWAQVLAVLALSASAAVALSQVVGYWDQPLNSGNVSNLVTSLLFLVSLFLPRLLADDQQNRSRQHS